jgi:acyl-coenzyme A thioesterase PaaI-like protein
MARRARSHLRARPAEQPGRRSSVSTLEEVSVNVLDIPFNRLLGIQSSDTAGAQLRLGASPNHLNHLETVHASAQFALAEAASGLLLLERFKEHSARVVPVVRRAEVKFSKPARGEILASAALASDGEKVIRDLAGKGRAQAIVEVKVKDGAGGVTMSATFEWFIQKMQP